MGFIIIAITAAGALDCRTVVNCSVQNEVNPIAAALLARGKIVLDTRSCLAPLVLSPHIINQ